MYICLIINQFKISEAKRYIPFLGSRKNYFGEALIQCTNPNLGIENTNQLSDRQILDLKQFSNYKDFF